MASFYDKTRKYRKDKTKDVVQKVRNKQLTNNDMLLYQQAYDSLDVHKVFELLDFNMHEGQQKVLDLYLINKEANTLILSCGRRFGKSVLASAIAVSRLLLPNASLVLFSPSFANSTNMYKEITRMIAKLPIKVVARNNSNLTFELENGSTFFSISPKNYESILGKTITSILVDEAALIPDDTLDEVLHQVAGPALASAGTRDDGTPYGEVIMLSSPRAANGVFFDYFQKGQDKNNKRVVSIRLPTWENPYIPESFIEEKKEELPTEIFETEYAGLFNNNATDKIFYNFDRSKHTFNKADILPYISKNSEVIVGLDIGYADSTSHIIVYVSENGDYYIMEEYNRAKLDLERHVENFKQIESNYPTISVRFIDPAAKLSAVTMANSWGYHTQPGKNDLDQSFEVINNLFIRGKLKIADDCHILLETLELLEWKEGYTGGGRRYHKPLPARLSHGDSVSALRYAIYTHQFMYGMYHSSDNMGVII